MGRERTGLKSATEGKTENIKMRHLEEPTFPGRHPDFFVAIVFIEQ